MMKNNNPIDIDLEFLPTGGIRFTRQGKQYNRALLELLILVLDKEQIAQVEEFLNKDDNTTLIVGNRIYCG